MLDKHSKRWPNIEPTLFQRLVFDESQRLATAIHNFKWVNIVINNINERDIQAC